FIILVDTFYDHAVRLYISAAAIAERFDTVFVDHIPLLGPEKRNQIKRFIILVDTFYDHAVRLYISAAAIAER
ncbi:AFG1/ZapE family ATPase, partial [Rhizobium ruizarguesonis]